MFTHEKYVGSICMIVVCISGITLLWISSWQHAQSSSYEQLQRTKLLWKFEPTSFLSNQTVAVIKLLCAGIMFSSLVTSILIKIFSFFVAIAWGMFIIVSWIVGLVIVWNYYFSVTPVTIKAEANISAWDIRERSADDVRLPVTVVTGYLGEQPFVTFQDSFSTIFNR